MKLYLSRQANSLYMLTYRRPWIRPVSGTPLEDLYVEPGDPVGFRHVCPWFAGQALEDFEPVEYLESVRVEMPKWRLLK